MQKRLDTSCCRWRGTRGYYNRILTKPDVLDITDVTALVADKAAEVVQILQTETLNTVSDFSIF